MSREASRWVSLLALMLQIFLLGSAQEARLSIADGDLTGPERLR